jgi:hypothetical protein
MTATAHMTPEEKSIRRRQLMQAIEPYNKMLTHIYSIMPSTGFIVNDGAFERLPPLPEWQKQIDKVLEMRDEFIKSNFPEFYTEK